MSPEDPTQFDSLASKLSAMQPASAAHLQALAFYEAGKLATYSRSAPAMLKLRSLAASVALAAVCSTAAYYAGSQRSGPLNSDINDNLAVVDLAQPNTHPASAAIESDVAQQDPVDDKPSKPQLAEQHSASQRYLTQRSSDAWSFTPLLESWFQLSPGDAEEYAQEYLRNFELRTRPPLSRTAAITNPSNTTDPPSRSPSSLNRQLPELERLKLDSPLRKWLSM